MADRQSAGPAVATLREGELRLGHVSGVFGVRGEVRLHLYNPESDLLRGPLDLDLVAPDGARRRVRLTCRPGAGKRILGRFQGVTGRDQALALKGWWLVMDAARLPALEQGEYYHHQLIGLSVLSASGQPLGRLDEIVQTAGHDTWVVRQGADEIYVPAVADAVLQVDLAAGVVRVADDLVQVL